MESQEFGVRLQQLRKQAGLTQRQLADRVNIDFTYLSKIESGVVPPPSEKVISQLAEVLKANKDELTILAGKVPSDLVQILKNGKTLQRLRSARAKQMAWSSRRREAVKTVKQLTSYKGLSRVTIPIVLVLTVAASLWFAAPAQALEVNITPPAAATLGGTHTFTVEVKIEDTELLPLQNIDLAIYYVSDTSKKATLENLPLNDSAEQAHTITEGASSGSARVAADAADTWGWFQDTAYVYVKWQNQGYSFTPSPNWGYGYQGGTGTTSITYTIKWTSPSSWPAGDYKIKVYLVPSTEEDTKTLIRTSDAFTLSAAAAAAAGPPSSGLPPSTVQYISRYRDATGKFIEEFTSESVDGKVELTIPEGTVGLTTTGRPLTTITIADMDSPPAPPEDSNVIGLVYEFGPSGATFDPPITMTFTYDPDDIAEGVNEEDLVIAMWDDDAGKWVELVCTVDPTTNTITAEVSHFTPFTVIAYTAPAAFTTSDLTIAPAAAEISEKVTISTLVTNTGDLSGSYEVTLKINNVVEATQKVTLSGGANEKVTFTTTKDAAGTYTVNIDGISGTFAVKAPPAPTPAPTPAPPTPAPAPTPAPPAPTPAPPAPAINWLLIGGIIAAAIIITVVIVLVIRRQRA